MNQFDQKIVESSVEFSRKPVQTLQINLGRLCNQACHHCHVEAGPKRKENMGERTVSRILDLLDQPNQIELIDITGGAPELNPNFRSLVQQSRRKKIRVMDRCNLTVLSVPGQEDTAQFLTDHEVEITASLPCYSKGNVDQQRGNGVFEKSIQALKDLNDLGYGKPGSSLQLNLVYNPLGTHLPPDQKKLEDQYKTNLKDWFGIEFNSLFTITNMPIKRFLRELKRKNELESYMQLLIDSFNPGAAENVMCRELVSIGYDGRLFDCDFNQMLELPIGNQKLNIWDIHSFQEIETLPIRTADHCFGCTAGAGSSCGGAVA